MAVSDDDLGLETPEVDRAEQLIPVLDDPNGPAAEGNLEVGDALEADEADVLEQAIAVPDDEDYPAGGA
jgi:hypothetical protein